ncbi:MAG: histidine phosphatase family protein, partial [Gallionellaceae bacterium]|nr:histidine phosphatase family protein [Gallionellaceae bacterium]
MDLILWRHAEAEDGFDDDMQRRLTAKGVKQADKMAAFLRPLLPKQTHILVSPAVRTQQTARALGLDFITEPVIAPGAPAEALLAAAKRTHADCVLLVGHQPCLGEAAALLMGAAHGWSVKKGAVWW